MNAENNVAPAPTMILHPPSTLIMGPAGTGKTTSIATALAAGLRVGLIATEPSAPNRVLDMCKKWNVDSSRFHWRNISPAMSDWDALMDAGSAVNTLSIKQLADMTTGIARKQGGQWIEVLKSCKNFVSERDGSVWGDVTEWGPDALFAIDGLTGLSHMARQLTVGLKPNPNPGEWGIMQQTILSLINKLASDCKCFFALISHIERENNEITGVANLTVSTLGAKLAPKLPPLFTNVVYAKRIEKNFYWSTADNGVDTKNGDLPIQADLPPSFIQIVNSYNDRMKKAAAPLAA